MARVVVFASQDNNMTLEHVTIYCVWSFCLCHLYCKHKRMGSKSIWCKT